MQLIIFPSDYDSYNMTEKTFWIKCLSTDVSVDSTMNFQVFDPWNFKRF